MRFHVPDHDRVGVGSGDGDVPAVGGEQPFGLVGDVVRAGGGHGIDHSGSSLALHFVHGADAEFFWSWNISFFVNRLPDRAGLGAEGGEDGDVAGGHWAWGLVFQDDLLGEQAFHPIDHSGDFLLGAGKARAFVAEGVLDEGGEGRAVFQQMGIGIFAGFEWDVRVEVALDEVVSGILDAVSAASFLGGFDVRNDPLRACPEQQVRLAVEEGPVFQGRELGFDEGERGGEIAVELRGESGGRACGVVCGRFVRFESQLRCSLKREIG